MKDNLKSKISILFVIILMILSTLLACNALAEELTQTIYGKMDIRSEHTYTLPEGSYIPYEDLDQYYDVFCCQKGTSLPGSTKTKFTANGTEYSYPYLTMNDIGKTIGEVTKSDGNPYNASYSHKTIGKFKVVGTYKATPEEAYVLAEMINVKGESENNACQMAWWRTEAGNKGNSVTANDLSLEAEAFEAYIKNVSNINKSGKLTEGDCKYKTAQFTDADTGENFTIENAFDFEYKPEWKSDGKYKTPTVVYDENTQQFTVGPFAIHYEGIVQKVGDRGEVQFAGITGMEIYTDASKEPLQRGQDWDIICAQTVRMEGEDYAFPKSDEEFYIKLNYIENATQITNIKTHFKYMNASGMYQRLDGKFFNATWEEQHIDNYVTEKNEDDEDVEVYKDTKYWLQLTSLVEEDAQKLAIGLNGSRWYEYTDLDRNIKIKSKSIQIRKKVIDGAGNKVNSEDFFDFKVKVEGAINSETEKIRVKANKSATSKTYYWLDGQKSPTYKVEEIPKEGYILENIENFAGDLDQAQPIVVQATNKIDEHRGKIEIVKKIKQSELDNSKYSIVGQKFKFKVTVEGTFKYDEKQYTDQALVLYPEVTAVRENENGIAWTSNDFIWVKDNAPKFSIEEIEIPNNVKLVSITPESGVLNANETIRATAINEQLQTGASIHIIKKLENAEYLTEEEIKELAFHFTVHVDGYDDVEVDLTEPTRLEENGSYSWVWEYTSSKYTWINGNEPNYSITEHDNPVGTTFVTATSDTGNGNVSGTTLSGTLVADESKNFIVNNTFINRVEGHKGNLELTKKVDTDKLINRDFLFVVKVSGKFRFENESEELLKQDRTIQFTNNSYIGVNSDEYDENTFVTIHVDTSKVGTWSTDGLGLGKIEWYGKNAPTYTVEENLAGSYGEGVKYFTVTPKEGTLLENSTVKVTALNYADEKESGRIHIIKTLENAEKYSADYINSLKFTFRISVDGYEPYDVELKANRVDNKFVWEYTSDEFFWEKGQNPNYTIEEINIPEGVEFVSAKGPDGATVSGTKISAKLQKSENSDIQICTENSYINKLSEQEGQIVIKKDVTHSSLQGKEFTFTLTLRGTFTYEGEEIVNGEKTIENIKVKGGSSWTSPVIKWSGKDAPTYSVSEVKSDIAENISTINGAGTLRKGTVTVTFVNGPKEQGAHIKIHKTIKDQPVNSNDKFTFKITVEGYEPYYVSIRADETYTSQLYKWYASENAPKYKVEEVNLPEGSKLVSISNAEGTLTAGADVIVEAVNQYEKHTGKFILKKEIVKDKINPEEMPTFEFNITVTGQFTFAGQESTTSEIWTQNTTIKGEGTYTSPEFIWYGDNAPEVHVEEVTDKLDAGWTLEGISNNNSALMEDDTLQIVATNRFEPLVIIELTVELAGTVWNDVPQSDDKNMKDSVPNGLLDKGEVGIDGVEVYIYDNNGNLATIYEDSSKNEIQQPIITANGGKWDAPRVKILRKGSYDVKFVYDGQTYEPTKPLVTGSAKDYKSASNNGRKKWANDSMALDVNREEVNQRLAEVAGNTPIDGSGNTVGTAISSNGNTSSISYEKSSGDNENRTTSKVVTLNENGTVKDLYKAEATTSQAGLTYPFDDRIHLESSDIEKSELGIVYKYKYSATYPYTLHINLGLVNREIADMDAVKDLVDAKVVVNERLLSYKFNKLADVGKDVLSRTSYINGTDGNSNIQYQLGFYKTDYYYRAEIYKTSAVYDYMQNFYKSIGQTLDATNLEVYLRYKISVYNESPSYNVTINEIADYFDSSFGAPITTEVKKYVQTIDGKETDSSASLQTVARSSYVEGTGANVDWNVTERGITGSDGVTYNKMTTSALKGMKLASGEKAEIYVYFKVQPTSVDGINDVIELADKSNIVEITNYSTYYSNGKIAGKIDVDSAPDNINIRNYNEKAYYEDDTDSAPVLKLTLDNENGVRSVSGIAWEDKAEDSDDNTAKGNGIYDEGKEALIGGLTTELIEKIKIPTGNTYTEYDFLWPTNENLSYLGGRTLEELTGFDSTTETGREVGNGEVSEVGRYKFTGVPVGNYVVRFLYGNDKSQLEDTFGITGDPVALKADATKFNNESNILVANYDGDSYGTTPAVYNGQDFKSTLYQIKNGETKTEWHSLKDYTDFNKDSDFMDNEARRLDVIAQSEVITNINGNVLATANTYNTFDNNPDNYVYNSNHADLYKDYYMFADTAKINFNIENIEVNNDNKALTIYEIETVETNLGNSSVSVITNQKTKAYEVNDVNFGLIERPETNIILDKEINSIKLTTNDGRVIFDAEYDISYKIEKAINADLLGDKVIIADLGKDLINHKYLVAEVELSKVNSIGTDVMQALDKIENKLLTEGREGTGTQNFRFINVDDTILQGTTIEINYKLTALNVSERDTISSRLANITREEILDENGNPLTTKAKIKKLASEVETESRTYENNTENKVLNLGKYIGQEYYTGTPKDQDVVVATRVRQLIDYVDTDGRFTADFNNTENHSWANTTVNELLGSGYDADRLIDSSLASEHTLVDKNGIEYITDQRNNLVLSIDNYDKVDKLNNNGFEKELQPIDINKIDDENYNDYKSEIALTITKTIAASDDADNLTYDNIAEIVKYENTAGRRDESTTPGNANPAKDQFIESLQERDQSATELVTFTPPTGLNVKTGMTLQILLISAIALGVVAVGIVIIKKKVL